MNLTIPTAQQIKQWSEQQSLSNQLQQEEENRRCQQVLQERLLMDHASLAAKMIHLGMSIPTSIPHLKAPPQANVRQLYESWYRYMLQLQSREYTPIPEADKIVAWLTDNNHKGLLLYGANGRGKTFLATYVIPAIIYQMHGIIFTTYAAHDAIKNTTDCLKKKFIVIDDIGTEGEFVNYGTKERTMDLLLDNAERNGNLIIFTSNVPNFDTFVQRYGRRFADRLFALTDRILFDNKKSFRGSSVNNTTTTDLKL